MHKLRAALAALATLSLSGCSVSGLLLSPISPSVTHQTKGVTYEP